jgi:3-hydroxybutyryl-CoA dehydrogenase
VVATHFWNPPHLVPLVEVGRGEETSQETVERACHLMERMNKKAVVVQKDILGFIGNRLQHALFREAISLVAQGVATPEDIDQVVLNSFGPRYAMIGIMEYMDMCGLDLIQAVHSYLLQDLDVSAGPSPLVQQKVKDGELGIKSGKGFYDWTVRDPQKVYGRRNQIFLERLK